MAHHPYFVPRAQSRPHVAELFAEFSWHSGMSISQKQKTIQDFHAAIKRNDVSKNPLEVSSKSFQPVGICLSSFNLLFTTKIGRILTVESAFQGSKRFEDGGPFRDLFFEQPKNAKRDSRLTSSGKLTGFSFFGEE